VVCTNRANLPVHALLFLFLFISRQSISRLFFCANCDNRERLPQSVSDSHFIYQLSSIAIMNRCGARASLGLICRQRLASSPTAAARLYSSATVKIEKTGEPVKVALIPSDGVGKEVVPEARRVLEAVEPHLPFAFSWVPLHAGWETFQQQGTTYTYNQSIGIYLFIYFLNSKKVIYNLTNYSIYYSI
jgi:hypothetical protein